MLSMVRVFDVFFYELNGIGTHCLSICFIDLLCLVRERNLFDAHQVEGRECDPNSSDGVSKVLELVHRVATNNNRDSTPYFTN